MARQAQVGASAGRLIPLACLALATSAASYCRALLGPLQETMRLSLLLDDNQIAVLQGPALALPVVLAAVPIGMAVDRFRRSSLLVCWAILAMAGSLLTAVSSNIWILFAARALVGLASAATMITAFSLLADFFAPAVRGRAKSLLVLGQYMGGSAAFAVGGLALTHIGSPPDNWRVVLVWMSAPLLVFIATTLALREPPRTETRASSQSWMQSRSSFALLWSLRRTLGPLFIGTMFVEIPTFAALIWTAPALARSFELPPADVGFIVAGALLTSGIIGPVLGGLLADFGHRRGGPRRTMIYLSVLSLLSIPTSFYAIASGVPLSAGLLCCLLILLSAIVGAAMTLFTIVTPNEVRGLCLALLTAGASVFGVALAPVLVSLLSTALGGEQTLGFALAFVCVVGTILATITFRAGIRQFSGDWP